MATITQLANGKFRVQIRKKAIGYKEAYFGTREEAERWASETEHGLLQRHHAAPASTKERELTFQSLVERYFASPVFEGKADSTRARERVTSIRLVEHFGRLALTVIDSAQIQDYFDLRCREYRRLSNGKVSTKRVSGDTIRLERAFLGALYRYAKTRKIVAQNIMLDTWELPKCKEKEARITLEQQLKLYNAAADAAEQPGTNPCFLPWLYFVFETGTRPGEAAKMELTWLQLDRCVVSIPRIGQKKRNARVVLLRKELADMLREQAALAVAAGSRYLFWSRRAEPRQTNSAGEAVRRRRSKAETAEREIRPYAYYHAWRRICARSGIPPDCNPHIVRHEFISRLFESTTLNDGQIAALVGDVNVLSLNPYKHLRVEQLRDQQDAHLSELNSALELLHKQQVEKMETHVRSVLAKAQIDRIAAGDLSTPMQRLHASLKAQKALKQARVRSDEAARDATDEG